MASNSSVSQNQTLQTSFPIYDEDVVTLKENGEEKIGYVTQLGWESDSESEDYEEDDDEEEEDEEEDEEYENKVGEQEEGEEGEEFEEYDDDLEKDEVLITWTDGSESVHNVNSIEVIDRALMPGDI